MNGYEVDKVQTHSPHETETGGGFQPLHLFPHLEAFFQPFTKRFLKFFLQRK